MIDLNNGSHYSNTKHVFPVSGLNEMNVIPNPVTDVAAIDIRSDNATNATLRIRSIAGNILEIKPLQLRPGQNKLQVNLGHLTRGIYLIEIEADGKINSKKIIRR